jgi:OPT oligopeptide transporter protein
MATAPSDVLPPAPTAETAEHRWLRTVYRPGVPQLTVRAVVVGMLLGALMCLSNLYVVLKVGWSFGVTITACVVAYGLFQLGERLGLVTCPRCGGTRRDLPDLDPLRADELELPDGPRQENGPLGVSELSALRRAGGAHRLL